MGNHASWCNYPSGPCDCGEWDYEAGRYIQGDHIRNDSGRKEPKDTINDNDKAE